MIDINSVEENISLNALKRALKPKSIAILGASEDTSKFGGRALAFLLNNGYCGEIFPVNPKYEELFGLKCYRSILDVPGQVDACEIVVPRPAVTGVLKEASEKRIKLAIVISTGFSETGKDEDKNAENYLLDLARDSDFRLLGPNCLGLIDPTQQLVMSTSISLGLGPVTPGKVGIISQSGAMMATLISLTQNRGMGLSFMVSTGNQCDLNVTDFLEILVDDPKTQVIGIYMEGVPDPERFWAVAERAMKIAKPIVVLKVGSSEKGKRAAFSHTGSLAGNDEVINAAFKQLNLVRVRSWREFLNTLYLFERTPLPKGDNVAVLTMSGGAAGVAGDICDSYQIKLPDFSENTQERLKNIIGSNASIANPLDIASVPAIEKNRPAKCLEAVLEDKSIDLAVYSFQELISPTDVDGIAKLIKNTDKPVVCSVPSSSITQMFSDSGLPVFDWLIDALESANHHIKYSSSLRDQHERIIDEDVKDLLFPSDSDLLRLSLESKPPGMLSLTDSHNILSKIGIPVAKQKLAKNETHAIDIANKIGFPVVMKISSCDIPHKSDIGGVELDLKNPAMVKEAYHSITSRALTLIAPDRIEGVIVQEMVKGQGFETIVGLNKDPIFGYATVFGMGGIFVETIRDFGMMLGSLSRCDAERLVKSVKGYKVLEGSRGRKPLDIPALVDVLVRISKINEIFRGKIIELDLNPLLILPIGEGVKALDFRIICS